jgi:hypothetical protein
MKRSTKVGLTFVVLGFLAGVGVPLVTGEDWPGIRRVAVPLYLGACFLSIFVLRFRESREQRRRQ